MRVPGNGHWSQKHRFDSIRFVKGSIRFARFDFFKKKFRFDSIRFRPMIDSFDSIRFDFGQMTDFFDSIRFDSIFFSAQK